MNDCLFCKIVEKKIPAEIVYENDQLLAFKDVDPQAPVHILIIPKEHIITTNDLNKKHTELIGNMVLTATKLATEYDIADSGYRTVLNCNKEGGQAVYHIHMHLLGGRPLHWPPG